MSRILATLLLATLVGLAGISPANAVDTTLSGTVTGPGGSPVTGGVISASDGSLDQWGDPIAYEAGLDQSGAFAISLPAGSYAVCTHVDAGLELTDECQDVIVGSIGASGVTFQLDPMPRVTGSVTNDAGTPALTQVDLYPPGYGTRSSAPFRGQTDGDGHYDVAAPAGTYTLCAGGETNSLVDRRCTPDVVVPSGGLVVPAVTLPRNSVITGRVSVAGNPYADLSSIFIDIFEFRPGQQYADEWHSATVRDDGTYSFAVPPNDYLLRFRGVRGSAISVEEFTWPTDGTRYTVTPGVHAGPNPVLTQSTGLMGTLTVLPTAVNPDDYAAGDYTILAYPQGATSVGGYANSRHFNVDLEGVSTIKWHVTVDPGMYRIGFRSDKDNTITWYGGGSSLATAPLVSVTAGVTTQGLHAQRNTTMPAYAFGRPTVTGTVESGQTLAAQANPSTWPAGTTFTYKWSDGSTGPTHVVTARDWQAYGPLISVEVTGHTPGYAPVSRISPVASGAAATPTPTPTPSPSPTPTPAPTPTPTPAPTVVLPPSAPSVEDIQGVLKQVLAVAKVGGTARVGKTLKVKGLAASLRVRAGVTYRFRWYAGASVIKKANKSTLLLTRTLKGKVISVKITANSSSVSAARKVKVGRVA